MSDTNADIKLAELGVRYEALELRVENVEKRIEDLTDIMMTIQRLSESVQQLASNMETMNKRVTQIEQVPADKWNTMTKTIFTAVLSAIAGGAATLILTIVSHFA